ncbi:hypothetical protein CLV49_1212 [Labedella gwakjiensis]|uniref:Alpha/beta hydrolase n=1 Tax=Labedella gwakjiensis TaxID=390269 RepID=A0A2P8GUH5_9MICO|nr:hydrolase [Labedella gwakjiensis]PSL37605.1 hypothetical protein CLV49_1212 [Labedella gwakjiensis]RUQ81698.1 alpha/beta hydrolase [Labedella gwakjiensis]
MSASAAPTPAGRFHALRAVPLDPRMSWCGFRPSGDLRATAVLVHGSDRDPVGTVAAFRDWAERSGVALVAPLFPGDVRGDGEMNGYKALVGDGLRYDLVLLDAVARAAETFGISSDRFLLFGFSGGAQFAHRFALAHPARLSALSIAAPGNVTLIGSPRAWWPGVRNVHEVIGAVLDLDALRSVPVHAVVGAADDGRDAIRVDPTEPRWVEGANDAGVTRGARLASLVGDWRAHGVEVRHEVLAGVAHELPPLATAAQHFFDAVLPAVEDGAPTTAPGRGGLA